MVKRIDKKNVSGKKQQQMKREEKVMKLKRIKRGKSDNEVQKGEETMNKTIKIKNFLAMKANQIEKERKTMETVYSNGSKYLGEFKDGEFQGHHHPLHFFFTAVPLR